MVVDRISLVIGLMIGAVVVATVALIAATVKPDYAVAGIMGGLARRRDTDTAHGSVDDRARHCTGGRHMTMPFLGLTGLAYTANIAAHAAWRDATRHGPWASLTPTQGMLISAIDASASPPCQADLGEVTGINRETVSSALRVMARDGLIKLNDCPRDGRAYRVSLTELGREAVRALPEIAASAERRLTKARPDITASLGIRARAEAA